MGVKIANFIKETATHLKQNSIPPTLTHFFTPDKSSLSLSILKECKKHGATLKIGTKIVTINAVSILQQQRI